MNLIDYQNEVTKTVSILKKGGTILYPTDTIWGLGCDALNEKAVEKVFIVKQRPENKSLILLVDSEEMLANYVEYIPSITHDLLQQYNRPLTIIYPRASKRLPKEVVAADNSIAIRIVKHQFCQDIIKQLGAPIVSTSANISGEPSPAVFAHINQKILSGVDHVVALEQNEFRSGIASTIIKLEVNGEFEIIRP
ncbi:MAG: threonylcarbamoyl-AMP synthase [Sphingobacteriia bacterium]|nr:threonylcarbamoyl-AMP synthase [Sphingobacteriia bacterium]